MKKSSRRKMVRWVTGVGIAGLAGCSSVTTTEPSDTPTGTSSETPADSTSAGEKTTSQPSDDPSATPANGVPETYRPTGREKTELQGDPFTEVRIDTLPETAPFSAGVEFLAQPADDEPGRLAVELQNSTDSSLGVEGGLPDDSDESETGIAVSTDWADWTPDDCPRGYRQADAATTALWFDPNETVQETYDIHVTHDEPVCFPEGAHRIESEYRVYSSKAGFNNDDDPASRFYWGFVLTIERS